MNFQPNWYTYLNQLQQYVTAQSKQIQQLQGTVSQLQKEIEQLKKNPTTNVERIEYKFDQLKIETLEGTLNIGLNPNDLHSIEDFAVQQDAMNVSPNTNSKQQQISNQIFDEINRYLDEECFEIIKKFETEHNRSLDESYYIYIIEDVKKQINQRITFYVNKYKTHLHGDESEKYQEIMIQRIKDDLNRSFSAFMQNLPNDLKGGIHNEFHGN